MSIRSEQWGSHSPFDKKFENISKDSLSPVVLFGKKETVTDDEPEWIKQTLAGDPGSFESLVRRYQQMIYALAFRMTGSAADARDLTQETFIRAHEQLASFRIDAKFSSWLYRIAMNQCLNFQRQAARIHKLHIDWGAQQANVDDTENPALAQKVQDALLQLPPKQRAAVVLTTFDGLNHAEAARSLNCSEATISWRVFAARSRLKKLLKNVQKGGSDE